MNTCGIGVCSSPVHCTETGYCVARPYRPPQPQPRNQPQPPVTKSPLHVDEPLPEEFRAAATTDWSSAVTLAQQILDDDMPKHVGSTWNTGHLWERAMMLAGTKPVVAAALLLLLSEQDALLRGKFPDVKT